MRNCLLPKSRGPDGLPRIQLVPPFMTGCPCGAVGGGLGHRGPSRPGDQEGTRLSRGLATWGTRGEHRSSENRLQEDEARPTRLTSSQASTGLLHLQARREGDGRTHQKLDGIKHMRSITVHWRGLWYKQPNSTQKLTDKSTHTDHSQIINYPSA